MPLKFDLEGALAEPASGLKFDIELALSPSVGRTPPQDQPLESDLAGIVQPRQELRQKSIGERIAGMRPAPAEIRNSPSTIYKADNPVLNAALGVPRAFVHGAEQAIQAGAGFTGNEQARKASERRVQGLMLESDLPDLEQGAGSMLAIAPAALINPAFGAAVGGGLAAGPAIGEGMEAGLSTPEAIAYGVGQGGLEYLTERIPLGILFGKGGAHVAERLVKAFFPEATGEQIATLTQDALRQSVIEPNKSWSEYWAERGEAAKRTLIATAGGLGAAGAIQAGVQRLVPQTNQFADVLDEVVRGTTLKPVGHDIVQDLYDRGRTRFANVPVQPQPELNVPGSASTLAQQPIQSAPLTAQGQATMPDEYAGPGSYAIPQGEADALQEQIPVEVQAPAEEGRPQEVAPPADESSYLVRAEVDKAFSDQYANADSRTTPSAVKNPPVGSWILDERRGIHGREIEQVVEIPVDNIEVSEDTGPQKWPDVERYAGWILDNKEMPAISVLQTDAGTLKTVDHRRLMAAKAAGKKTILARVSRSGMDGDVATGYTFEMAQRGITPMPIKPARPDRLLFPDDAKALERIKQKFGASAANSAQQPPVRPARAARPSNNLIRRIHQLGGINLRYLPDVAGERKVQRGMPVGLFRKNGMGLDDLSRMLADEGFPINVEDPTDIDGVRQLTELLQKTLSGSTVLNYSGQQAMLDAMAKAEAEMPEPEQTTFDDPEAIAEREAIKHADIAIQGVTNDELDALLDAAFNDERTPNAILSDEEIDQLFASTSDASQTQPEGPDADSVAGSPEAESFALDAYTPEDLKQREVQPEPERPGAPSPADFVLSGSNRQADEAEARGQTPMFSIAWTSPLADAIQQSKQDTMPAAQWKAWLLANKAKLGLKDDEIQWSGINEYLDLRGKEKVTKAEIADYLSGNGVKVGDVVKGGTAGASPREYEAERISIKTTPDGDFKVFHADEYLGEFQSYDDAIAARDRYLENFSDIKEGAQKFGPGSPQHHWEGSYKGGIPGTYREILVTLPEREAAKLDDDGQISFTPEKNNAVNFRSSHWDEPNVLVHVRLDEVTGADGKRYVRVGEVQSDWGQQGKKAGFRSGVARPTPGQARDYFDLVPGANPAEYVDEMHEAISRNRAPDAPFVTDTKAWVALGIKRAILHALDVGADGVVFGTGEQNANLYDLSKQVEKLEWVRDDDAKEVNIGAYQRELDSAPAVDKTVPFGELQDVVGKEIADRILQETKTAGTYRGIDLKVGGEGMRAFYDRIVPQVANEVLKKMGGGKVVSTDVKGGNQPGFQIPDAMRAKVTGTGMPLFVRADGTTGKGMTAASATAHLRKRFGKRIDGMLASNKLKIVATPAQLPAWGKGQRGIGGAWDGTTAWIVASQARPETLAATYLHEVGEHAGMQEMLGDKYQDIITRLDDLIWDGDATANRAASRVPKDTPAKDEQHERLAYFIEEAQRARDAKPQTLSTKARQLLQDIIAAIRAWAYRKFGGITLTEADILALARQSAKQVADRAGQAQGQTAAEAMLQKVWHGTPHIWAPEPGFPHGRPRLDKMGTGEGAQAYGWGWYSAETKEVAGSYIVPPGGKGFSVDGKTYGEWQNVWHDQDKPTRRALTALADSQGNATEALVNLRAQMSPDSVSAAEVLAGWIDQGKITKPEPGSLYQLDIPDATLPYLLDWDKPLLMQSKQIKELLKKSGDWNAFRANKDNFASPQDTRGAMLGRNLYAYMAWKHGGDKAASEYLANLGIVGNRHLDGQSRADGAGTYNYVIWDQPTLDKIALLERNGEKLDAMREAEVQFSKEPQSTDAEEMAKKFGFAIKGMADARIQPSAERAYIENQEMFERMKRGVVSNADSKAAGEALAAEVGWSPDSVDAFMKEAAQKGTPPVDILAAMFAMSRMQSIKLLEAQNPTQFIEYTMDVLRTLMATRAYGSEMGRALQFIGAMERMGGYTAADVTGEGGSLPRGQIDAPGASTIAIDKDVSRQAADLAKEVVETGEFNETLRKTADAKMSEAEMEAEVKQLEADLAKADKALSDARKAREAARQKRTEARQSLKHANDLTKSAQESTAKHQANTVPAADIQAAEDAMRVAQAEREKAWAALVKARQTLMKAKKMREKAQSQTQAMTGKAQTAKQKTISNIAAALTEENLRNALGGDKGIQKIMAAMHKQGKDVDLGMLVSYLSGMVDSIAKEQSENRSTLNKLMAMHVELWRANILTGLFTHEVNVTSNAANMLIEFGLVNPIQEMLPGGIGLGGYLDALKSMGGYRKVLADIWALMKYSAFEEAPASRLSHLLDQRDPELLALMRGTEGSKWADTHRKFIPGLAGKVVRGAGFVPLGIEDAIFKVIPFRYELARQQAAGEQRNVTAAIDAANKLTFQDSTGMLGMVVAKMHEKAPYSEFWITFVKTMTNLIKRSFDLTPGLSQAKNWDALIGKEGDKARREAIALSIVGVGIASMVMALMGDDDDEVQLSGFAPYDRLKKLLWLEEHDNIGLRIGDEVYPFYRMSPLAEPAGLTIGAYNSIKQGDAGPLFNAMYQSIVTKHFMAKIADLIDGIEEVARAEGNEKSEAGERLVRRQLGGIATGTMIPNFIAQLGDMTDAEKREVNTIMQDLQKKIPGLRESLPSKLKVTGEVLGEQRYMSPFPVQGKPVKKDEVTRWLLKLGRGIDPNPKSIKDLPHDVRQTLLRERWEFLGYAYEASKDLDAETQEKSIRKMLSAWTENAKAARVMHELETPAD